MFTDFEKKTIETSRLNIAYLEAGRKDKPVLLLIHGNTSSSLFYLPTMEKLQEHFHIYAPDLRGYGLTEKKPIDATKGMKEWSEDLRSFVEALSIEKPHLMGWSMGGGVAMQYTLDYKEEVASLGLINPLSPYGFSGTKDVQGTLSSTIYAGTGGGLVNRSFVENLRTENTDLSDAASAPNVLKGLFAPDFTLEDSYKDLFVEAMFQMSLGDDFYPGASEPVTEWPFLGPGKTGIGNTMSPKYVNLTKIKDLSVKPPIIWFRGAKDQIVSDQSFADVGYLGQLGILPGWPGLEVYPPQPMVAQTRDILSTYEAQGGRFEEVVFEHSGHSPQIEEPEKFLASYLAFLS